MNQFLKIISGIRRKFVEPKVYCITLNNESGGSVLWCGVAYSFEDAFKIAVEVALRDHKKVFPDVDKTHLGMWVGVSIDILFKDVMETSLEVAAPVTPVAPEVEKNLLMQQIIETNDSALLEENRSKFSEPEIQFLENSIKKK